MKASTRKLTDEITYAIGPVFQANPDYTEILPAMCLVMAKVILSTPDKGREEAAYTYMTETVKGLLDDLLSAETQANAKKEDLKAKLEQGIAGLDQFAKPVGEASDEAGNIVTASFASEATENAPQEPEPQ
jgi:hypothetical protein